MKFCLAIGKTTSMWTPLLYAGSFVDNMAHAKELGYDGVEIHVPSTKELDVQALNEACEKYNMFIATLGTGTIYGTYGLHLMDENEDNCQRLIGMVKEFIDVAALLKSKVTIGSIKGNVPAGADREQCIAIMGKNLQIITSYAYKMGVTVLLEATNRLENNVLNTGKEVFDIIEKYHLKSTQILMDSFHINIEETDISNCLKDAGKYLGHIHFSDNTRWYPSAGCFRFDEFNQSIKDIGYDGVLSAECLPRPDGETAARNTIQFFQKNFTRR